MKRGPTQGRALKRGLIGALFGMFGPSLHRALRHALLGWRGYQGFVARRYLMVQENRVSRAVRFAIFFALAARIAIGLAAWGSPSRVLWGLERAAETVLVFSLVVGVLRHSRPALYMFSAGAVLAILGIGASRPAVAARLLSYFFDEVPIWFGYAVLAMIVGGAVLAGLALFFGTLRAYFTFFTTVPIGGVWIGTAALVCVLSVMSGFASDLREKILGSNAHIQVTREDGELTGWRDVKARIDKIPGVVASTPYAVSEVVIAAHNNGQNVIIKGIDPKTVGNVTQLVSDLKDKNAMTRLQPLVEDPHDLRVESVGSAAPVGSGAHAVDPAPVDMPSSAAPIDFSQPAEPTGSAAARPTRAPAIVDTGAILDQPAAVDRAPPDMPTSDSPPIDYRFAGSSTVVVGAGSDADGLLGSGFDRTFGSGSDAVVHIPIDASFDAPAMSQRTLSLPGVLVGAELVKQTHLYEGEEVRVVSPLSDPSNPDATGTPIPFNRDYRVAGVFFTGMYEYDLKYVYVTLDSLQEFLDRGDAVDGIEVRITDPDETDKLVPRISAALGPQYRVQDWKELNRSLFSALKLEKVAMFLVLGIVILVASFSIVGNLIMVVVEKQREIALLKTLGGSDGGVMQIFAIQGLLIGLIGTTLGVATGLVACYFGKHYGIPLNPDVYYIDRMPVQVDAGSVFWTFLAGVVISIAATFYPAVLAARVRPAAGMRH